MSENNWENRLDFWESHATNGFAASKFESIATTNFKQIEKVRNVILLLFFKLMSKFVIFRQVICSGGMQKKKKLTASPTSVNVRPNSAPPVLLLPKSSSQKENTTTVSTWTIDSQRSSPLMALPSQNLSNLQSIFTGIKKTRFVQSFHNEFFNLECFIVFLDKYFLQVMCRINKRHQWMSR